MRIIKADFTQPLLLGKQGEHGVTQVAFDLSWYIKTYGDGVAQLVVKRPGDPLEYAAVLTQTGDTATWDIGAEWTQVHGQGYCYLHWIVDTNHVKSDTFKTLVQESKSACDAPEPQAGYLDQVLEAGVRAVRAAGEANTAANTTRTIATRFGEVASAAIKAIEESAEESKRYAEQAEEHEHLCGIYAGQAHEEAIQAAEAALYGVNPPIIGDNGNWWLFSGKYEIPIPGEPGFPIYEDSGKPARGETGPRGEQGPAYELTEADKQELVDAVLAALPNGDEVSY